MSLRRFDGNATFLLIFTGVRKTCFSSFSSRNDTSFRNLSISINQFKIIAKFNEFSKGSSVRKDDKLRNTYKRIG